MQRTTIIRAAVTGVLAAAMVAGSPAVAQEVNPGSTSLEPLENIIANFSNGIATDGLTLVSDDQDAVIQSQFQIMVNFSPNPEFAREEVALAPWGFVAGSTTEIESLAPYFDPPDQIRLLPPLNPWIDPYSRLVIADGLEGWTVYGEEGIIEGIEDAFEPLQSVWGIELAEPFDTTCQSAAYVGRAWEGSSVTSGPDPMFTQTSLQNRFGGTHQALVGTASRVVQLVCSGGGPIVSLSRNTEESGIRPFGPTGTIAMVKDRYIVFFSPVRILDGDLGQQFFATPPDGGPVEVTVMGDEPKLLVPNPYAELGTKVTIVPIEEPAGEAAADTATGLKLLQVSQDRSAVRTQTGGGCTPRADVIFMNAFTVAALKSGFAQVPSVFSGGDNGFGVAYDFPDGSRQIIRVTESGGGEPETWEAEMINSSGISCETAVDLVSDGKSLAVPSVATTEGTPAEEPSATPQDDGAAPPADTTETDTGGSVPLIPIALAVAGLAGAGYAVAKTKSKKAEAPPEQAPSPPPPPPAKARGPRTFTAEDRAALQEVYKGADEAGLKVVGIAEITRLEDVLGGSKKNPVLLGKATKIALGVTEGGSLVAPSDESAASRLTIEVVPSIEFDSDHDAHVVWSAYTQDIDAATRLITNASRSGLSNVEWKAKVNGRSDVEIGNDKTFKDWVVESMPESPAEAVREALNKRG